MKRGCEDLDVNITLLLNSSLHCGNLGSNRTTAYVPNTQQIQLLSTLIFQQQISNLYS